MGKRMKKKTIKQLRAKLDTTFNRYIRLRDGACILCGTDKKLQCSHYYGKKQHPSIRWDERNAHAMCAKHHFLHHHGSEPDYSLWMLSKYGKVRLLRLQELSRAHYEPTIEDIENEIIYFQSQIDFIEDARNCGFMVPPIKVRKAK